jgi:hypothetical protein
MKRNNYINSRNQMTAAQATAAKAYAFQQKALAELTAALKKNLRYAENTVNFDDHKLKLIGWSGKRSARPVAVPGQTRTLQVGALDKGKVKLTWQPPADGGRVDAYTVQRRRNGASAVPGRWQGIHTAVRTETILEDQPGNEVLEYRIIAINTAGRGEPGNTETIIL